MDEKLIQMRNYWLGRQSGAERASLEDLWFDSNDDTELLAAVRDELIEDYLANDLTSEENSKFKSFFLGELGMTAEVAVSAAIRDAAVTSAKEKPHEENTNGLFSWFSAHFRQSFLLWSPVSVTAAACLVILMVGAFWFAGLLSPRIEIAGVQVPEINVPQPTNAGNGNTPLDPREKPDQPKLRPSASPSPSRKDQEPRSISSSPVTLVLGTVVRGDGTKIEASIPENASEVRLVFPMPGLRQAFDSYAVRIISDNNGKVVRQMTLRNLSTKRFGEDVVVTINRPKFIAGDYKLILLGTVDSKTETILERGFRVKP